MNLQDGYLTQLLLSGKYNIPAKPDARGYRRLGPDIDWERLKRDLDEKMAAEPCQNRRTP
jgi:hypothetical protein